MMPVQMTCGPCGELMTGDTEDELVEKTQQHARADHGVELSREQILAEARAA